jgi:hypothetical protein
MQQQTHVSIRFLLLMTLLVIGPVQSQTLFACEFMNDIVLDSCCCGEMDKAEATALPSDPCCEKTLELTVDHTSEQAVDVVKPVEVRSDVDPPPVIWTVVLPETQVPPLVRKAFSLSNSVQQPHATNTYLLTQRLRI